jgi:hypothetical protein
VAHLGSEIRLRIALTARTIYHLPCMRVAATRPNPHGDVSPLPLPFINATICPRWQSNRRNSAILARASSNDSCNFFAHDPGPVLPRTTWKAWAEVFRDSYNNAHNYPDGGRFRCRIRRRQGDSKLKQPISGRRRRFRVSANRVAIDPSENKRRIDDGRNSNNAKAAVHKKVRDPPKH